MISNFPKLQGYNPGGYTSFQFIPKHLVTAFPMISNGSIVVPVSIATNTPWFTGYASRETLNFEEDPQFTANGTYYNITVSGFLPGSSAPLIDMMESMPDYRYLIVVKDPLGKMRLVGTPAAPLTFSAKYVSGTNRPDAKGFDFKFTGESLRRAPLYIV